MPRGDGGFVALGGASDGFLDTPAELPQYPTHVCGMVLHAELLPDERRHTLGGPHLAEEAVRFGALGQQRRELLALRHGQPVRGARRRPLPECLATALPRPLEPSADRALRYSELLGNRLPRPALLVKIQGAEPAALAPARRCCASSGRHACRFTITAGTLAPYAEVSSSLPPVECSQHIVTIG